MEQPKFRLEPELVSGQAWRVVVATGSKKRGTREARAVSEPVYTLAQAQAFCSNNRVRDYV